MSWARREFLRVAAALGGALALRTLPGCADDAPAVETPVDDRLLPTLGGAPDTHEGRTVAALCDVVVPGRHRDPTGAPGALDVGAPGMFFDPELPAAPYVPLLVVAIDGFARQKEGAPFVELGIAARERALEHALRTFDLLEFAIQLAKLAYFSSRDAGVHLGYPGANPGYLRDADFSFGRAMARELTVDGNPA